MAISPREEWRAIEGYGDRYAGWSTRLANVRDKAMHQTQPRGTQMHDAKLTESIVRTIRASKDTLAVLAARYGTSTAAVCFAKNRQTWRHVKD